MQRISWVDLGRAHTNTATFWVLFRLPVSAQDWAVGPEVSTHLNPPVPRADEIVVDARQSPNMTDARRVPFLCLKKAVMRACLTVYPTTRLYDIVGHVRLQRYRFRAQDGDHNFDELVVPFMALVWLYGPPVCLVSTD
jgi:hypothetical protein